MIPRQKATEKAIVNPNEFSPSDWGFDYNRSNQTWNGVQEMEGNPNMFAKDEGYQQVKNGMFSKLTGNEGVYGHVKYHLNPRDQEQTNAQMSAYQAQKATRVSDNMNPFQMALYNVPSYQYPINNSPNVWANRYNGSQTVGPPYSAGVRRPI